LLRAAGSKYFFQNRRVARILDLKIDGVANVIEKGLEAGIAVAFGGLFGAFCKLGQKGQDLIGDDGFNLPPNSSLKRVKRNS
jgi:hypothetical protein